MHVTYGQNAVDTCGHLRQRYDYVMHEAEILGVFTHLLSSDSVSCLQDIRYVKHTIFRVFLIAKFNFEIIVETFSNFLRLLSLWQRFLEDVPCEFPRTSHENRRHL